MSFDSRFNVFPITGMAFALLTSVAPIYGLYTSFFPVVLYMLFGTGRHVSTGKTPSQYKPTPYLDRKQSYVYSLLLKNTQVGSIIGEYLRLYLWRSDPVLFITSGTFAVVSLMTGSVVEQLVPTPLEMNSSSTEAADLEAQRIGVASAVALLSGIIMAS